MSILKLYLPHRTKHSLKPTNFTTYEEFYKTGAVRLCNSAAITPVQEIVDTNRSLYEQLSDHLQSVWEDIQQNGRLEDAWANIAPQTEQERLDDTTKSNNDGEHSHGDKETIPDLDDNSDKSEAGTLCSFELIGEPIRPLLRTMNDKQRKIFYHVREWCVQDAQG